MLSPTHLPKRLVSQLARPKVIEGNSPTSPAPAPFQLGSVFQTLQRAKAIAPRDGFDSVNNLGSLDGRQILSGAVSNDNPSDYYKFELKEAVGLNLLLGNLSDATNLKLYRANPDGSITQIANSSRSGTRPESIVRRSMSAGTYYVRVKYAGVDQTDYTLTVTTDAAGNDLPTAKKVGRLDIDKTVTDFIGDTDSEDYYRFEVIDFSEVAVAIDSVDADISMELSQDRNGNHRISDDEVINFVVGDRNQPLTLNQSLSEGTYYLQVKADIGSTNYRLSLAANALPFPEDKAGNTLKQANDLGILKGTKALNDFVGSPDPDDYYRFELSTTSRFQLDLGSLSTEAEVHLIQDLNNNGKVEANKGEILSYPFVGDNISDGIDTGLAAGTYYIHVTASFGDTPYQLKLAAEPIVLPPQYNPLFGYGIVNAAAAVAQATGSDPFPAVADSNQRNWGLDFSNVPEVWQQGYSGKDIVVAVVDTGVDYTHPDLNDNLWLNADEIANNGIDDDNNGFIDDVHGWNFTEDTNDLSDFESHGTHVAGLIAAEANDFGITGVAYEANIMPVKVLDSLGNGTATSIAAGIRYAVDNGADVINLSLGGGYSTEIEAALEYAKKKRVVSVIAAGNEFGRSPGYPAEFADRLGIAVGAIERDRKLADFSNRAGYKPLKYVVAPGVDIYSTTPDNHYEFLNGTSMAAPHVAGIVALMLSAKPRLTPIQVEDIITATASPQGIQT